MESTETSQVAIIILNWNGWEDTIACLNSLLLLVHPRISIYLLDNASTDESCEILEAWGKENLKRYQEEWSPCETVDATWKQLGTFSSDEQDRFKDIYLLHSPENKGFAGGHNLVLKELSNHTTVDFVMLLNNDTIITQPTLLRKLLAAYEPSVGIISCAILRYDNPYKTESCGGRINWWTGRPSLRRHPPAKKSIDTSMIHGCMMFFPLQHIETVGLMDERFFLYFEDAEYSERMKAKGFRLVIRTDAYLYHKISRSVQKTPQARAYYFSRNRILFNRLWNDNPRTFFSFLFIQYVLKPPIVFLLFPKTARNAWFSGLREGWRVPIIQQEESR